MDVDALSDQVQEAQEHLDEAITAQAETQAPEDLLGEELRLWYKEGGLRVLDGIVQIDEFADGWSELSVHEQTVWRDRARRILARCFHHMALHLRARAND